MILYWFALMLQYGIISYIVLNHGLRTPDGAFFQWYHKLVGLGRQIGLINFVPFGVLIFSQTISTILALWGLCPLDRSWFETPRDYENFRPKNWSLVNKLSEWIIIWKKKSFRNLREKHRGHKENKQQMLIFDTAPPCTALKSMYRANAQFSAVWEICPIISSSGRLVHILWLSKERWISPISLKWDSAKALRSCYCLNWVSWAHPSFPKSYALIKHWKNYRKMTQEIQKVSPSLTKCVQ